MYFKISPDVEQMQIYDRRGHPLNVKLGTRYAIGKVGWKPNEENSGNLQFSLKNSSPHLL